jgi:hypothetical protein
MVVNAGDRSPYGAGRRRVPRRCRAACPGITAMGTSGCVQLRDGGPILMPAGISPASHHSSPRCMSESTRPNAADRQPTQDPSGLQRRLTAILRASPAPTICVARSHADGGDLLLAGASLLDLARKRIGVLSQSGMRRGDVLASETAGIERVVDALAAILGGFVYWPCRQPQRFFHGPSVGESGATLVWRVNPHIDGGSAQQQQPAAAVPARMPVMLHDAIAPAGQQVRMLLEGAAQAQPFAVNAQTLGRLGSTLRRRLGIQSQSVRYCAAPAISAAGVLLDLIPGIAGRQVIVLPNEVQPSAVTIMRAISRYHPDALTLTLAQAIELLEMPMEESALSALQTVRLLVADTHPIPHTVRSALAARVQHLDLCYILPEAGDAVII